MADSLSCHVRQVAEDAGLFHPRVRSVVLLADGGEWIENRFATPGLPPRAQVFDILDFRHFQQHVWGAAKACWGESSARTKTWAHTQIDQVVAKGPGPLLRELATIRPRRAQGRQRCASFTTTWNITPTDSPLVPAWMPCASLLNSPVLDLVHKEAAPHAGVVRLSMAGKEGRDKEVQVLRNVVRSGKIRSDQYTEISPKRTPEMFR